MLERPRRGRRLNLRRKPTVPPPPWKRKADEARKDARPVPTQPPPPEGALSKPLSPRAYAAWQVATALQARVDARSTPASGAGPQQGRAPGVPTPAPVNPPPPVVPVPDPPAPWVEPPAPQPPTPSVPAPLPPPIPSVPLPPLPDIRPPDIRPPGAVVPKPPSSPRPPVPPPPHAQTPRAPPPAGPPPGAPQPPGNKGGLVDEVLGTAGEKLEHLMAQQREATHRVGVMGQQALVQAEQVLNGALQRVEQRLRTALQQRTKK
ncbi:hypothetical protein JYJ95_09390 [Corallococcus exiguus]|uniref:hypothetical protein n=1 Tax=Corallococcus exiguus TaxID=83462 RepID=UPI001A8EEF4B|nr:hypothetical protein [Corallococcus exiguus]MBN8466728.1 hypothetical protein [Corallococcus exiguus]